MKVTALLGTAALAVLSCLPLAAHANTFTVYATGVDNSGNLLPNGSIETHYSLQQSNTSFTSDLIPDLATTDGYGNLFPMIMNANYYLYTTTFDLTGLNPSTASLQLQVRGDDSLEDILINGISTGDYTSWYGDTEWFTINSGFVSGVNTLSFEIPNFSNPSEFAVYSISGTAGVASVNAAPTPEPSSLMLLGTGILGVAGSLRRKLFA